MSHVIKFDPAALLDRVLFLEIYVRDASKFSAELHVPRVEVGSRQVLRAESAAVPNEIAAVLQTNSKIQLSAQFAFWDL